MSDCQHKEWRSTVGEWGNAAVGDEKVCCGCGLRLRRESFADAPVSTEFGKGVVSSWAEVPSE